MEIKILHPTSQKIKFKPVIGEKMNDLGFRLKDFLDEDEFDSLVSETGHILSRCSDPKLNQEQDVTHLTVGYVQSGKTLSFTALTGSSCR